MGKNKRKIHLTFTNRFFIEYQNINRKKMVLKLLRNSIRQNRGKYLRILFDKKKVLFKIETGAAFSRI